jgi:hypothetical protein
MTEQEIRNTTKMPINPINPKAVIINQGTTDTLQYPYKQKLRGFSPQANYTDQAIAASRGR